MYDSLIVNTHLAASIIFGLAVIYLLAGLISPALARASGRGVVVLRSTLGIFLAIGLAVGVIVLYPYGAGRAAFDEDLPQGL
jgi:hypothetical protein